MLNKRWREIFLSIGFIFYCSYSGAQQRIAIIDTGLNTVLQKQLPLCKNTGYDYLTFSKSITGDTKGHGSNIAVIINQNIKVPYCLIIYRVYKEDSYWVTIPSMVSAVYEAVNERADVINISLNGSDPVGAELKALQYASSKGIRINVAAGNGINKVGINLDKNCISYPSCYKHIKNLRTIGSKYSNGNIKPYSNYGSVVDEWYEDEFSFGNGTSYATAVATANYINKHYKKGKK